MTPNDQHIKVFIAYARKDVEYLNQLRTYLAPLERNKTIEIWYDGEIVPGTEWENEIKTHLQTADIILLLVSANSLASDYFHDKEMMKALERHRNGEAVVIPVILSECLWRTTQLADLQALPKNGKAINTWNNQSLAYTNVAEGLNKAIRKRHNIPEGESSEPDRISKSLNERLSSILFYLIPVIPLLIGINLFIRDYQINKPFKNDKSKIDTVYIENKIAEPTDNSSDVQDYIDDYSDIETDEYENVDEESEDEHIPDSVLAIKYHLDEVYYDFPAKLVLGVKNKNQGLYTRQGEEVIPPIYYSIDPLFSKKVLITKKGKHCGVLDENGKTIFPSIIDKCDYDSNNTPIDYQLLKIIVEDKIGLINGYGKIISEPNLSEIERLNNEIIKVKFDGKWGLLNINGTEITPKIYDDIHNFDGAGVAFAILNGEHLYIDKNGNKVNR